MMNDAKIVANGIEFCKKHGYLGGFDCKGHIERYTEDGCAEKLVGNYRSECPYGDCKNCVDVMTEDASALLTEQKSLIHVLKRKGEKGHWIYGSSYGHGYMKCSICLVSQDTTGCFSFCPNCGAEMTEPSTNEEVKSEKKNYCETVNCPWYERGDGAGRCGSPNDHIKNSDGKIECDYDRGILPYTMGEDDE